MIEPIDVAGSYEEYQLLEAAWKERRFDLLKEEHVVVSQSYSASRAKSGDPWDALSAEQKIRVLQQMVQRETARVMPLLLRAK